MPLRKFCSSSRKYYWEMRFGFGSCFHTCSVSFSPLSYPIGLQGPVRVVRRSRSNPSFYFRDCCRPHLVSMDPSTQESVPEKAISESINTNVSSTDNAGRSPTMEQETGKDAEAATPDTPRFPETDLSRGIVGWDSQDDPKNPQNFPSGQKWGLLALMSGITFVSPLASSMFSPTISYVGADLGVQNEMLLSFSISIYLLGYSVCNLLPIYWEYVDRGYSLVHSCSPP